MVNDPSGLDKKVFDFVYLVASDDKMIPPMAQRFMAERAGASVVEVAGSHAIYVSQPEAVASLIKTAAQSLTRGANAAA